VTDNQQQGLEDDAEVASRLLCRGFIELHLKVRSGEIVDPFASPEVLGQGMQSVSRLCLIGGVIRRPAHSTGLLGFEVAQVRNRSVRRPSRSGF
jgi:hypothetical protein